MASSDRLRASALRRTLGLVRPHLRGQRLLLAGGAGLLLLEVVWRVLEPWPTKLVVDAVSGSPRLAYEVVSHGRQPDGTPSRLASYVDARTGKVYRTEQQIQTADNGSGQSLYSGTVGLTLTQGLGGFTMKDPSRGNTCSTTGRPAFAVVGAMLEVAWSVSAVSTAITAGPFS